MKNLLKLLFVTVICLATSVCLIACEKPDDNDSANPPPSTPPASTSIYINGMEFNPIKDGTAYEFSDVNANTDSNLIIPETCNGKPVTAIGNNALLNCSSVVNVTVPASINTIGINAFKNCTNLKTLTFKDNSSLLKISSVFSGCSKLETVNFGQNSSLEIIDDNAFLNCSKLSDLEISDKVISIGEKAFYGCSSIQSVTLPATVNQIGIWAFERCTSLTAINVNASNTEYKSVNGILFSKDGKTLIKYPAGKTNISYTLPDTITIIEASSFSSSAKLEQVNFGANTQLTVIGASAFNRCFSLKEIKIPSTVTSLKESAFKECIALKTLTFQKNSKLLELEKFAFSDCTALESIDFGANSILKTIGQDAFHCCESLKKVTIPESVERIENFAFEYCGLQSVSFGSNAKLKHIGTNAFTYCEDLNNVVIPKSITKIDLYAFDYCFSLTNFSYEGTIAEWSAVQKGAVWRDQAPFSYVQCSNGRV